MKMYKYFFLLLLIVNCNKQTNYEINTDGSEDCMTIEMDTIPTSAVFYKDIFQYKNPTFNPLNNDEFVYSYKDYSLNINNLTKINLKSGVKTILHNNVEVLSKPKWNRKGWIVFDRYPDYQLWKIKENGDSLSQLTTYAGNLFPTWDVAGNFIYFQHSPVLGHPYYFLKQNITTMHIDTVMSNSNVNHGYSQLNDISKDNNLVAMTLINNTRHIAITSLGDVNFEGLIDIIAENHIGTSDLAWSSNGELIYFTGTSGLFEYNVQLKEYKLLIESCDNKTYSTISCSPDGRTLICERIDTRKELGGKIFINSSIYLIDLLTLTETKINL